MRGKGKPTVEQSRLIVSSYHLVTFHFIAMVKPRDHDVVFMEDGGNNNNETSASSTVTSTGDCVAVDVGPATPLSQSQQPSISVSSPLPLPSPSTMSLSETTGNRIYKQLLREYYDRYFHPVHGTPTEQNRIRKILLDRFHERIGAVSVLSNIDHDIDGDCDGDGDIDIDIDVEANCSAQRRLAMSPLGSAPVASPANQGREGIVTSTSTILPSTATPTSTSTSTSAVAVANSPSKPQFLVHRKQGKSFCFNQVFFKRNIDQKIVSQSIYNVVI